MKRSLSFMFILISYIIAVAVAAVSFYFLKPFMHTLLNIFIADTVATIIIYAAGLIFKNSSVYDPYWSVIPPFVLAACLIPKGGLNINDILLLIAVFVWAVRLTANWAHTFKGMSYMDWRYTDLKNKHPKLWPLINFFGIQYMPTLCVFAGMLPFYYITLNSAASLNIWSVAGFIICIGAALLQLISDSQMHRFRRTGSGGGAVIDSGLWRYSRHPNYLGEISFWWGIFVMGIGFAPWYAVFGAVIMTLLFVFISIPLMERHMVSKRPKYKEYQKQVSMLLLLPRRKPK